jgi:hypothetical protein
MSQNYTPGPADPGGRRGREETSVGWVPGQHSDAATKSRETKLRLLVIGIGLLFLCIVVTLAIVAYYLI